MGEDQRVGNVWVGLLAYDPDESGSSSPQRSPQPIAQQDKGCAKIAQWAEGFNFFSTRVLVSALPETAGYAAG